MKKGEKSGKKSGHRIALGVLTSVIFTILIVSIVNVGLSIFLEAPDYNDYCKVKSPDKIETQAECDAEGGKWDPYSLEPRAAPLEEGSTGYCDTHFECREEHDEARDSYNQIRYYVFAVIGVALFFLGAYAVAPSLQYTGLASGAILLTEGIVTNFENKVMVFVSLLIILVIFGFLVFKKLEKK